MGLFDKMNTDGTGSTGLFLQEVVAFAKLDLNGIFKTAVPAVVSLITNAKDFFSDVFGHSNCNDQDAVLVERFLEQIPGIYLVLKDMPDFSGIRDLITSDNPEDLHRLLQFGRPHGAHPCNELLYPARLLFTILFGVRMTNSNYLDALAKDVDSYYAAGSNTSDIPRIAVERAVFLRKTFFPPSTENETQWDLNKFQQYPLVAPIPDPIEVGVLYTGDFLGMTIVNGMAIGSPIPLINPDGTITPGSTDADTGSLLDKIMSFVKTANPLLLLGAAAAAVFVYNEIDETD